MTVRRTKTMHLDRRVDDVREAIDAVLRDGPIYEVRSSDGRRWAARIHPRMPLILSTELDIALDAPVPDGIAVVVATTTSQWFILGDLFRMYPAYLDQFGTALVRRLAMSPTEPTEATKSTGPTGPTGPNAPPDGRQT